MRSIGGLSVSLCGRACACAFVWNGICCVTSLVSINAHGNKDKTNEPLRPCPCRQILGLVQPSPPYTPTR